MPDRLPLPGGAVRCYCCPAELSVVAAVCLESSLRRVCCPAQLVATSCPMEPPLAGLPVTATAQRAQCCLQHTARCYLCWCEVTVACQRRQSASSLAPDSKVGIKDAGDFNRRPLRYGLSLFHCQNFLVLTTLLYSLTQGKYTAPSQFVRAQGPCRSKL